MYYRLFCSPSNCYHHTSFSHQYWIIFLYFPSSIYNWRPSFVSSLLKLKINVLVIFNFCTLFYYILSPFDTILTLHSWLSCFSIRFCHFSFFSDHSCLTLTHLASLDVTIFPGLIYTSPLLHFSYFIQDIVLKSKYFSVYFMKKIKKFK